MSKLRIFTGRYRVEFSSADPIGTLMQLNKTPVNLYRITHVDEFTIQFDVKRHPGKEFTSILDRYAETYCITEYATLWSKIKGLQHRTVLLIGILMLTFLTCFLPTRVLFVRVKGNTTIPTSKIIDVGKSCGIDFAASRRDVRSEEVKNRMIAQLPQLDWVGINTYGCVAEISVQEGVSQESPEIQPAVASIIASRDGVILSCTTLQGTQICHPGQAVSKGQLLVSGYTDCGIYIQGTHAKGDVLAATTHELRVKSANTIHRRYNATLNKRQFYLTIGNNLIKFYKDSGIPTTSCVKIKKEYPLTLPGGFVLPICLVEEHITYYEAGLEEIEPHWAVEYGRKYLNSQMIAGKIISEEIQSTCIEGVTSYEGKFFCTEMIGQIKFEETM